MKRKWIVGAALAVAVVATGIGVMAGRNTVDDPRPATSAREAEGMTGFRDEPAGFALAYPEEWNRYAAAAADIRLVASEHPPEENRGGSLLVRVIPIGTRVTADRLAEARQLTDELVAGEGIELKAEPTEISEGGLPGYYYLYTFVDEATGQRGAHSHYFLFKDENVITLVFQALPDSEFSRLARTFDDIVGTFRVLEEGEEGDAGG